EKASAAVGTAEPAEQLRPKSDAATQWLRAGLEIHPETPVSGWISRRSHYEKAFDWNHAFIRHVAKCLVRTAEALHSIDLRFTIGWSARSSMPDKGKLYFVRHHRHQTGLLRNPLAH